MFGRTAEPPSFVTLGSPEPRLPVVLAVPHAGRCYPPRLLAESRLAKPVLDLLADSHADRLIRDAVAAGASAVVATRARAWIDLNRDPREIDVAAVAPSPHRSSVVESAKVRAGLGVVPTRIAGFGDIARRPIAAADLAARIADDHRPYHAAVAARLSAARARFGRAILLDVHSMPTLDGPSPARSVIGDRRGLSASQSVTRHVAEHARARWPVALNDPYAGGYTLERHGRPHRGISAVQIEFDRSLYLAPDGALDAPGVATISRFLAALVTGFGSEDAWLRAAE